MEPKLMASTSPIVVESYLKGAVMAKWRERLTAIKMMWSQSVAPEVPADIEICEFGCRREACSHGEWENCERRKQLSDKGKTSALLRVKSIAAGRKIMHVGDLRE
jgi:hypothetical protein